MSPWRLTVTDALQLPQLVPLLKKICLSPYLQGQTNCLKETENDMKVQIEIQDGASKLSCVTEDLCWNLLAQIFLHEQ